MTQPRLQRRYELREPNVLIVDLHQPDCACPACEGMREAEPAPADGPLLAAFREIGWWCLAGLLIGHAIAFAIDPHGAWLALSTMLTGEQ